VSVADLLAARAATTPYDSATEHTESPRRVEVLLPCRWHPRPRAPSPPALAKPAPSRSLLDPAGFELPLRELHGSDLWFRGPAR